MKRSILISFLLLFAAISLTARAETKADKAAREGILLIGNGAEPQDLDPHIITGIPESHVVKALFEGLIDLDPKTLQPVPAAAESWILSADKTVYTFQIRPTAKWSDGSPVTAQDFLYGWQRVLSPELAASYANLLYPMKNAEAFNKGTIKDFSKVGARAVNAQTVEITLQSPMPHFLSVLNMPCWYPVQKKNIEKFGKMSQRGTKWTRPGNLVGNGPFVLKVWQPDEVIEVAKNPAYWDAKSVRLNGIRFFPVSNRQTEERMFRTGELHVTENIPINKIKVYEAAKDGSFHNDPYLGVYFYRLNTKKPPLNDGRVRRALAMAVDRQAIVKFVTRGGQQPAGNFTPPGTAGYTSQATIPYDVAAARKLLVQAGYPGGKGFPEVELLYNTDEQHKTVAEAIQQMWQKNLGIRIRLVNQDWKVYLDTVDRMNYMMARGAWIGDYIDPSTFLDCWMTDNGNNKSGYSSKKYDDLMLKASRSSDQKERYALFQEAEKTLLE